MRPTDTYTPWFKPFIMLRSKLGYMQSFNIHVGKHRSVFSVVQPSNGQPSVWRDYGHTLLVVVQGLVQRRV